MPATTRTKSKKKTPKNGKTEGVRLVCKICGEQKSISQNFYKSDRPEYAETGYCDVCKSCMKDLMIEPETGMIDKLRFKLEVCKLLDIPFVPYEFTGLMQNPKVTPSNFFGEYRKKLTLVPAYRGLHYDDSARFENDAKGLLEEKNKPEPDQVTPEMIEFWGRGFPAEYYLDVQKRYDNFMEFEDEDKMDYKKQSDYKMLCHYERKQIELIQDKSAKPSDLKAISDVISKLSEDLNIKAIQKKNEQNDTGHYIIGLVTKYIEDVKKTPIPKLEEIDWLGEMDKNEFEIEMAYFKSEMLNELGRANPYLEIVENDKKKYSPTQEELEVVRLSADEVDD